LPYALIAVVLIGYAASLRRRMETAQRERAAIESKKN